MASTRYVNTALDEFLLSVEELGAESTRFLLSNYRKDHALRHDTDARFVISMIATMFRIPEKEITQGVHRNNERRDAIGFCVYYLWRVLEHDIKQVELMLSRSRWVCYKHVKRIENLNPETPLDKKYLSWMKKFDKQISKRKIKKHNHANC